MAWTNSKIISAFPQGVFINVATLGAIDLDADTFEVALFDNTVAPSQTDTWAHNSYAGAGGAWAAGGVVDTGTSAPAGWPALGRPLASVTVSAATVATFTFDAADTVSANAVTTLTNAFGCLVYDHTIAGDPGLCFNYFGGANTVTLGSFSVIWNASGIFTIAL